MSSVKVVRRITYEVPAALEGETRLRLQLAKSLRLGVHDLWTRITVEHLEGPTWESDGTAAYDGEERRSQT